MSENKDLDKRKETGNEIEERKRIKKGKKRKKGETGNTGENNSESNKFRDEIQERKRIKKEKKRKRRDKDSTEDKDTGLETSQNQSEEIEENDIEDDEVKKPKEPSKRQIKREKLEKKYAAKKEASKLEAAQKALNYISKWKHAKSDWKFEKLRQIWLMDHLLDDNLIPDTIFPIVLEYFEGCKGMARQQLVKKMMQVVKKIEEMNENEGDTDDDRKEITNTPEYLRAREILQALPIES